MTYSDVSEMLEKFLDKNSKDYDQNQFLDAAYLESLLLEVEKSALSPQVIEKSIEDLNILVEKRSRRVVKGTAQISTSKIYLDMVESGIFSRNNKSICYELEDTVYVTKAVNTSLEDAKVIYSLNEEWFLEQFLLKRKLDFAKHLIIDEDLFVDRKNYLNIKSTIFNLEFDVSSCISADRLHNPWNSSVLLMTPVEPLEQKDLNKCCVYSTKELIEDRSEILKRIMIPKNQISDNFLEYEQMNFSEFKSKVKI